jgi:hypothetical protein
VPSAAAMLAAIPPLPDKDVATRGALVINCIADLVPNFLSGSADLHGANKN